MALKNPLVYEAEKANPVFIKEPPKKKEVKQKEPESNNNSGLGMNFSRFVDNDVMVSSGASSYQPQSNNKRRKKENTDAIIPAKEEGELNDFQTNEPYKNKYAETDAILKTAIAQIDIGLNELQHDISEIRARCRRLASSEQGLGLVIIDYLQLINSGNKKVESRQVEVSDISRSLKTMALELNVPVIALSQLSRTAEKRESNVPMLADLRESGSLEQDADMVLFINRKDYYDKSKDQNETIVPAELIIAKHRKGSLGTINLQFELNIGLFRSEIKEQGE